ncbi:diguanylate cyclase [Gallaecimonas sp. GXIMD4217]|uniref:diguanylate cyclase n=1 Tax=Gallaecimonas sp. GXIMD4217 TaxID=3131927 RepID=UPI00311B19C0
MTALLQRHWPFTVLAALLALAVAWLPFELLPGQLYLVFPSALSLLCAYLLGWRSAALVALAAALGLLMEGSLGLLALAFALEGPLVAWLMSRKLRLLSATAAYWALLGGPLALLLLVLAEPPQPVTLALTYVTLLFNGLVSGALAKALCWNRFMRQVRGAKQHLPPKPSLEGQVVEGVSTVFVIFLVLVMLAYGRWTYVSTSRHWQADLLANLDHAVASARQRLAGYHGILATLAQSLGALPAHEQQLALVQAHLQMPGASNLGLIDSQGELYGMSPPLLGRIGDSYSVADRDYFQVPSRNHQPYQSDVFRGRGLGSDDIMVLSHPFFQGNALAGVVSATLDLAKAPFAGVIDDGALVVLSPSGKVVYRAPSLPEAVLASLPATPGRGRLRLAGSRYGYAGVLERDSGWRFFYLRDEGSLLQELASQVLTIMLFALVALLLAHVLMQLRVRLLLRPLRQLIDAIPLAARVEDRPLDFRLGPRTSAQIWALYDRLERMRTIIWAFQEEMESRIAERTRALEAANAHLAHLASHDGLTGLNNRQHFDQALEHQLRQAALHQRPLALILLDVDHFKALNDNHGHPAGDACLQALAAALKKAFDGFPHAMLARVGGEEFAVLLPGASLAEAGGLAERLRGDVEGLRLAGGLRITASLGVAATVTDIGASHFYARADRALYQAKHQGRNRVCSAP